MYIFLYASKYKYWYIILLYFYYMNYVYLIIFNIGLLANNRILYIGWKDYEYIINYVILCIIINIDPMNELILIIYYLLIYKLSLLIIDQLSYYISIEIIIIIDWSTIKKYFIIHLLLLVYYSYCIFTFIIIILYAYIFIILFIFVWHCYLN